MLTCPNRVLKLQLRCRKRGVVCPIVKIQLILLEPYDAPRLFRGWRSFDRRLVHRQWSRSTGRLPKCYFGALDASRFHTRVFLTYGLAYTVVDVSLLFSGSSVADVIHGPPVKNSESDEKS